MQKTHPKNTVIRHLRKDILDMSQEEFGELIGAARDTVASWENGRNPVGLEMAHKIQTATGADAEDIQRGSGILRVCPTVRSMEWHRRYPTERTNWEFREDDYWRWVAEVDVPEIAKSDIERFKYIVCRLIRCLAAAKRSDELSNRGKCLTVIMALESVFDKTEETFGLKPHLSALHDDPSWVMPGLGKLIDLEMRVSMIFSDKLIHLNTAINKALSSKKRRRMN